MNDELGALLKQMSIDMGRIETKVDFANNRINELSDKVQTLERTVLRRETIQEGVDEFRRELSTRFMWCVGYCTALCGIIIALMKTKAL
jgi:hypothetical protein